MLVLPFFERLMHLHQHRVLELPLGYEISKNLIKDGGYNFLQSLLKSLVASANTLTRSKFKKNLLKQSTSFHIQEKPIK